MDQIQVKCKVQAIVFCEGPDYPFIIKGREIFTAFLIIKSDHQHEEDPDKEITLTMTFPDAVALEVQTFSESKYAIRIEYPERPLDPLDFSLYRKFTCTASSPSPLLFRTHFNGEKSADSAIPIFHNTQDRIPPGTILSRSLQQREFQYVTVKVIPSTTNTN